MKQHWIGGGFLEGSSGDTFEDLNPLDDSVYAEIASGSAEDVNVAVESAHATFQSFRKSSPGNREAILLRAAELLQRQQDEFIDVLIDETGSPISKAKKEIASATAFLRASAGTARRITGSTLPTDVSGRTSMSIRRPIGVIAGITPFNVPLIKSVKHAAMPLATGNTVVLLPSEDAPVTALRVAQLFSDAGAPDGSLNIVNGIGSRIGDSLTTHPLVKMVSFTGSTRVGNHIQELCGRHRKRCVLEMGGKNALVVMNDGDLARAVAASVMGSFLFQGQICMSSSRIFVERSRLEEFLDQFVAATRHIGMGDLRNPQTMIGPIINTKQRNRIRTHIDDATSKGAKIMIGGQWEQHRCQPTILSNVAGDSEVFHEETFGPVTAVYPIDSVEQAISQVNESRFGLSASIFTADLKTAMRFVEEVDSGMVHVNGSTIQEEPHVPFGGTGQSGFGREGTEVGIDDLTEWKWITLRYE